MSSELRVRIALTRFAAIATAASISAGALAAQSAATLSTRIQSIVDRPAYRHAFFGVEFFSLDCGRPIYAMNADKLFVPGSTTKVITEGTALELLGADYRFHTRVYRTGDMQGGTVNGDLVLVASGDPNLSARVRPDGSLAFENEDHSYDGDPHTRAVPGDPMLVIRELAAQVAANGVRRVKGRVLVDATLFASGDRELGTGVVISPIMMNDNLVDLTIAPGAIVGTPAGFQVSPSTSYARFVDAVTTGAPGSKAEIRFKSDTADAMGRRTVIVAGSMPAGGPAILYSYAVPDPTRYAELAFADALREKGVSSVPFTSTPDMKSLASSYVPDHMVAEHISPVLSQETKVTLKVSQNLHASAMPRTLRAILAPNDTTKTGFDLERDFLTKAGLDVAGAQQADGAGGDAHFTPAFMVSFLEYMSRQKDSASFRAALPILGHDGTLWNIQPASPAAGHVFAKTGTFAVDDPLNKRLFVTGKGLAGYLTTVDNRHLALAIYVNNVSVSATDPNAMTDVGQALGEIAAAAYDSPPEAAACTQHVP